MKLQHSLLAAALLAAVSTSAVAQSTGVVTLGGTIVPSSCTLTLDNGGVADAGSVDAGTLAQTTMTMQPEIIINLQVGCTGPTLMALTIQDNQDGTSEGSFANQLGLGLTSTGKKVGRVGVATQNATINSSPGMMIQSGNLSSWSDPAAGFWNKKGAGGNIYRAFGTVAGGPTPLTTATVDFRVMANLNSRNALQLTQSEPIAGNATIEVHYL